MQSYRHWGWACSPYSAKTRGWMRFKGVMFEDEVPHLGHMLGRIRRSVGRVVMPVVITPDGTLLQDSTAIIDAIDAREAGPSAIPETPVQRVVARIIELFADEWLPIIAMHTRWNLDNRAFIEADFGRCAAPWLPKFAQRTIGRKLATRMAAYLPKLGITPTTITAIEAWADELLDKLEAHLHAHRFLLGDAPCVGDFALMGPLHAHLERDPASAHLIAARPAVKAWLARVHAGERGTTWLADDAIPTTLGPVLTRCFTDQLPFLADTAAALTAWRADNPERRSVPRSMGKAPMRIGEVTGERTRITYSLWMLQRVFDAYDALDDQRAVDAWLSANGGAHLTEMPRPPKVAFEGHQVVFA